MKTYINSHCGELDEKVLKVLKDRPDLWDTVELSDLLHTVFYDVLDESGNLLAFFGNSIWNNGGQPECVVCCVYVFEEYRQQGIFKKIIRFSVDHNPQAAIISIGAKKTNQLANDIYYKMFTYHHFDAVDNGYWYIIKDRRAKK